MADEPKKNPVPVNEEEKDLNTESTSQEKKEEAPKENKEESKSTDEEKSSQTKEDESKDSKHEDKKEEKPKEEEKPAPEPKLSKEEKKQIALDEKNTDPEIMDLVDDIKEVVEELKEINKHPDLEEIKVEVSQESKNEEVTVEVEKVDNGGDGKKAEEKKAEKTEEVKAETQEDIESEAEKPEDSADQNSEDEKPEEEDEKKEEKPKEDKEAAEEEKEEKKSFFSKIFKKKPKKEDENKDGKPKKSKKKLLIILIIFFIPIIFIGLTAFFVMPVYKNGMKASALAQETIAVLKSQNLPEAEKKLLETKDALNATNDSYQKISYLKVFPFLGKYVKDGQSGLNAALAGVEAGDIALSTINPYADVLGFQGEGSFQGGTTEERIIKILETMGEITPNLEQVSQKLDIASQEFNNIDPNDYPETFKDKQIRSNILKAKEMISQAAIILNQARPMINVLPQVMGYPDTQKYMILFQNDGELRATGGFLSAYSIVNVEKGKVLPETSNDIYALDNKFNSNIEPPEFIKKHLNEKRWYLRNMNTSPDFKVSMDQFITSYKTIPGAVDLNGIIAIDSFVLEQIIEIIGPVEVPGYGTFTTEIDERCNLTQVVCELEHIIDKPLATIASNRKADILGPMMSAILAKIFEGDNTQLARLAPLLFDLLEQKHVLAYFTDETTEEAAEAFNIAGRIEAFQGDYLHINDSNFGGAKTNFYIDQEVNQKIEIADDGTITKTIEISYTHTEPGDNCNLEAGELCLSGIQRNYFRVYVPEGSILEQGLGSQVEITTGQDLGKTYFDGFFELRPESKAKVMLVYILPFKAEGGNYDLLIQKQAGTESPKYIVDINGREQDFILDKDKELNLTY